MRLHVTGRTWIGVIAPGSANIRRFFQQGKLIKPGLFEPDGHTKATETGSDDNDGKIQATGLTRHCMFP